MSFGKLHIWVVATWEIANWVVATWEIAHWVVATWEIAHWVVATWENALGNFSLCKITLGEYLTSTCKSCERCEWYSGQTDHYI